MFLKEHILFFLSPDKIKMSIPRILSNIVSDSRISCKESSQLKSLETFNAFLLFTCNSGIEISTNVAPRFSTKYSTAKKRLKTMRWTYFCQQKFANEWMIDGIIIISKSRNNYSEQSLKIKLFF